MKLISTIAAAALIATTIPARAGERVPVMIEASEYDACASTGVVAGLDPNGDGFLAVKAGPGLKFDRIDKVYNGQMLFLCGRVGDWFAVVYTRKHDPAECGVTSPWPRTLPYTGPCLSGWVHRRWVEVVAG